MPSISRRWKKIFGVCCNHAHLANRVALESVLRFRNDWKPDTCVHLGDTVDMAAFMSSACGTANESEPLLPDIEGGLDFLERLRPTLFFCGNHEARAWKLRGHHNAVVSFAASKAVEAIEDCCKRLRAELVPYTGVWQHRVIGGFKWLHGTIYNENATRDMAEMHGNCVHGHTHRPAVAKGRRDDNPTAFCVGTLADIPNMDYANTKKSTLSWAQGFVWGEYCDDQSVLWLHEQPRNVPVWRLPAV